MPPANMGSVGFIIALNVQKIKFQLIDFAHFDVIVQIAEHRSAVSFAAGFLCKKLLHRGYPVQQLFYLLY